MTNQDLITDALRLVGVLSSVMEANAEDSALAMTVIGEMVDEWNEDGVYVNWSGTATLTDDSTLSGQELSAVKHHLGIRLCPYFGREPPQTLIALAGSIYNRLQRNQMVRNLTEVRVPMPAAESGGNAGFDITGTGDF
jgi:hypothetical protein